jgi:hypothetical protein
MYTMGKAPQLMSTLTYANCFSKACFLTEADWSNNARQQSSRRLPNGRRQHSLQRRGVLVQFGRHTECSAPWGMQPNSKRENCLITAEAQAHCRASARKWTSFVQGGKNKLYVFAMDVPMGRTPT